MTSMLNDSESGDSYGTDCRVFSIILHLIILLEARSSTLLKEECSL